MGCFSLSHFKMWHLIPRSLINIYLDIDFLVYPLWDLFNFLIVGFFLAKFGELPGIISLAQCFSSPSQTWITQMLDLLLQSKKFLRLCSFFKHVLGSLSLCYSASVISIFYLLVHWIFHLSRSLSYWDHLWKFLFQFM